MHAFTVDLEDWYQGMEIPYTEWHRYGKRLEKGLYPLLALLEQNQVRATFFVLGWIAQRYPHIIKQIYQQKHEIAIHSHLHEKVYHLNRETFRQDTERAIKIVEDLIGEKVRGYRAPYFSITQRSLWALEVLADLGIEYDSSIAKVKTWRYGIPHSPDYPYRIKEVGIIEYPVSTLSWLGRRWLCGGAYFRILPYQVFYRFFTSQSQTKVFYLHPWELDPEHPKLWIGFPATLTHYARLSTTKKKLKRLLKTVSWRPLVYFIRQNKEQLPFISIKTLKYGNNSKS